MKSKFIFYVTNRMKELTWAYFPFKLCCKCYKVKSPYGVDLNRSVWIKKVKWFEEYI